MISTRIVALAGVALLLAACRAPMRVEPTSSTPGVPVQTSEPTESWSSRPIHTVPDFVPAAPEVTRPTPVADRPLAGRVVVVDAGHGGVDPGARSAQSTEKAIVLAIARRVADGLRQRGALVHMTRDGDVKIPLEVRAQTADRVGADLLVSIHADAAENTSAHGVGVWLARRPRQESVRAGKAILDAAQRERLAVRSIHNADFKVLVGHGRPSVLVETGFLSNAQDARQLATTAYQARVATVIVDGITNALR